ncbi:MAG TPA: hypothetical protein VGS03_03425 [Candidatus Polarisedimenticolia bacterium]|jgi:photosystem II stability/assembly factor-like uncharacterized protein|nr:hypothetical protein [Candidatus Polarisedimenticolia bacterium]
MKHAFNFWSIVALALLAGAAARPPLANNRTQASLYRSEDAGATWKAIGLGSLGVNALAIDPVNPSTLYAGTGSGGVFKSTDWGETWSARNSGLGSLAINALGIDRAQPSTLHAATTGGLFESSDGGSSWSPVGPTLSNPVFRSVAFDPVVSTTRYAADAVWVARSVDSGTTWTYSTVGGDYVTSLLIDPATPSTLYAGVFHATPNGGGVYKSIDGGLRWSVVSGGIISPTGRYYDVNSLAIDPAASIVYAGTSGGGVFRSDDAGKSWTAANAGLGMVSVRALAIDPRNPSTMYSAADGEGIFKSSDGARTWTAASAGLDFRLPVALAIDPANSSRVYAGLRGDLVDASAARIAARR